MFRQKKGIMSKLLVFTLALLMAIGQFTYMGPIYEAEAAGDEQILTITGTGLELDVKINQSNLDENKMKERYYSSNNSINHHKIYKAKGYDLFDLIGKDNLKKDKDYNITFICSDKAKFNYKLSALKSAFYYSDFKEESKQPVAPMLTFYKKKLKEVNPEDFDPYNKPITWDNQNLTIEDKVEKYPSLMIGQKDINDKNQSGWASDVVKIVVGEEKKIDILNSPYKHIAYPQNDAANPYNVDVITGATLTVEGPGVEGYRAISMRQIEEADKGLLRDNYKERVTVKESGANVYKDVENTYEGISVEYILKNFVKLKSNAGKIVFKDKTRKTIGEYTLDQIKGSGMILAYGINEVPLVYLNTDKGYIDKKYNDDGCLKLVFKQNTAKPFSNVAYIYVQESDAKGDYEHKNKPYNDPKYTNYILTITGTGIGKEVNYTVKDIENMKDIQIEEEYSLSNSENFWYYNQYKGVGLWKLLQKAGIDKNINENTKVQMIAADNYNFQPLKIKDIKNDSLYGYYEKDSNDGKDSFDPKKIKPIKKGYPVLVSYGFNGYPYVVRPSDEGYNAGLRNDGGPLRVIFGKTSYDHTNGSKQVQFAKKIVIGDEKNYTTHSYDPYASLGKSPIHIMVQDENGKVLKDKKFTVQDIENMIYGAGVSEDERNKSKVKDMYFTKFYKDNKVSDLYEGIGLWNLLSEKIGLPGAMGTVALEDGAGNKEVVSLEQLRKEDYFNEVTGIKSLKPILAFAKNGYPLVKEKIKEKGYVEDNYNNDGPLMVLFGQSENGKPGMSMKDVQKITVKIEKDKYAHLEAPYDAYGERTLTISGKGAVKEKTLKIKDIEFLQNYIITDKYALVKDGNKQECIYGGIDLYEYLRKEIGVTASAATIKFIASDGFSKEYSLEEIRKNDYINEISGAKNLKVMLAYGKDYKPLVPDNKSTGYDKTIMNDGGPLKLIIGQTGVGDSNRGKCINNVVKIEITASDSVSWKHDHGIYKNYEEQPVLRVTGSQVKQPRTFTLKELESLNKQIVRSTYTGDGTAELEGISLWHLIQDIVGLKQGVENPSIRVFSGKNFNQVLKSNDQVKNGVINSKGETKEIILAYAKDGYPLVPKESSAGYENNNQFGPVRLIIEENKSMWIKWTDCIVVGDGDYEEPLVKENQKETVIFKVKTNNVEKGYTPSDLKKLEERTIEYKYKAKESVTDKCTGVFLSKVLDDLGVTDKNSLINLMTTDGYKYDKVTLQGVVNQNYFVAYKVNGQAVEDVNKDGVTAYVRVYRNFDDGTTWKNKCRNIMGINAAVAEWKTYGNDDKSGLPEDASIRCIAQDSNNGIWAGTYGSGAIYKDKNGQWTVYNEENDQLNGDTVFSIQPDNKGGIWLAVGKRKSQYDVEGKGVAYKKGNSWAVFNTSNSNLPSDFVQDIKVDKAGGIWFATSKGAAYKDKDNKWTIYNKNKGFPADSVTKIVLDNKGGVWFGFYPDMIGKDQYAGGYAYLDVSGKVITYQDPSDTSFQGNWVRSISIDKDGGVWICCSGSYEGKNAKIHYIKNEQKRVYDVKDIYPSIADGDDIRLVVADKQGGLWLGTRKSGVLYRNKEGNITKKYNSTNEWTTEKWDNIFYLDIDEKEIVWVGTDGGFGCRLK